MNVGQPATTQYRAAIHINITMIIRINIATQPWFSKNLLCLPISLIFLDFNNQVEKPYDTKRKS